MRQIRAYMVVITATVKLDILFGPFLLVSAGGTDLATNMQHCIPGLI